MKNYDCNRNLLLKQCSPGIISCMKTVGRSEEVAVHGFRYWTHLKREKELVVLGVHEHYHHVYPWLLRHMVIMLLFPVYFLKQLLLIQGCFLCLTVFQKPLCSR